MIDTSHREQYRIRSAEVDPRGRATPTAIANLLQEAAASGARQLGVAVEDLRPTGSTWYLDRLHLVLRRPPWLGETVEIETWPSGLVKAHALRDFRLFLDGGIDAVEIGSATSGWLLIDLESGKPRRRFPERLQAMHPDPPRRVIETPFARLPKIDDPPPDSITERPFPLRRTDLDVNGHVNYGIFVDALMEAVPDELWSTGELHELEVDFRAEANPGDDLLTRAHIVSPEPTEAADEPSGTMAAKDEFRTVLHAVVRRDNGLELARARSRWSLD